MEIFKIRIDRENATPRHRQLADAIIELKKKGVTCGVLIHGKEFLPGERTLAKKLNVSRDVVHRAYKILQDEGLIRFTNHIGHCLAEDPAK